MKKYRLNIARDVDRDGWDEDGGYILNLPNGYRIDDGPFDPSNAEHVRGFDSMAELKNFIRDGYVVLCECNCCR